MLQTEGRGMTRLASLALFLDQLEMRTPLNEEARQAILSLSFEAEDVGREHAIIQQGETPQRICLLAEGLAARAGRTPEGSRQITAIYVPGDMPALPALVLPTSAFSLCTLTKAKLLWVSLRDLRQTLKHPQIMEAFWRHSLVHLTMAWEWEVNIGRRPAEKKIGHLLCEIAVRLGAVNGSKVSFQLGMTQQQFADACGISVVHANRSFQTLRQAGLIESHGDWIAIADWAKLTEWSEFDQAYLYRSAFVSANISLAHR
jgi:CRP-like cAMP-binding protein